MRRQPEREIQINTASLLRQCGVPGIVPWHTPNAPRNAITGSILKRMGMLAGVSDWLIFYNRELFSMELKAEGGKPTDSQIEFHDRLRAQGAHCAVAEGFDQAHYYFKHWGLIR